MKKFLLLSALLLLPSTPVQAENANIKLGVGLPLSGEAASIGEDVKVGISLAAEEINAHGGVLGRKLEPVYGDSACDPKNAVAVANRFVTMNVDAAVEICSSACLATAPIYAEENIPFIVECSSEQMTTQGWGNIFRAYPGNNQEAAKLSALIKHIGAHKKIAMIYGDQEYNINLAKIITTTLEADKIKPTITYNIVGNPNDYASYITKLKEQGVEVVYLGLFPKGTGLFLRQAHNAGFHPQFISTQLAATEDVKKIAGEAALEGLIITNVPDPKDNAAAQAVVKTLATRNIINRPYTVYSYVLAQIYAAAAQKAGSTDKALVIKAMKSGQFPTAIGNISFTPNGDMLGLDFQYTEWQGTAYKPWKMP